MKVLQCTCQALAFALFYTLFEVDTKTSNLVITLSV